MLPQDQALVLVEAVMQGLVDQAVVLVQVQDLEVVVEWV